MSAVVTEDYLGAVIVAHGIFRRQETALTNQHECRPLAHPLEGGGRNPEL